MGTPDGHHLPSSSGSKLRTGVRTCSFFLVFLTNLVISVFYGEQIFHRLTAVTHNLTGPDGNLLTRRPYRVGWFMNQLSEFVRRLSRFLSLLMKS